MIYSKENNFLLLKNYSVNGDYIEGVLSNVLPQSSIITKNNKDNYRLSSRNESDIFENISFFDLNKKVDVNGVDAYIIIRNPYHSVFVDFFHKVRINKGNTEWNSFSEEEKIEELENYFFTNNFLKSTKSLYIHDNMFLLKDVIFYEDGVEDQLNIILEEHSIPKIKLNMLLDEYTPEGLNFLNVFPEENINQITEEWEWEFDNFGYEKFVG